MKLQNIDAEIAETVMLTFARSRKACLGVHDSFVVKAEDEALLRATMIAAYQQVMRKRVGASGHVYDGQVPAVDKKTSTKVAQLEPVRSLLAFA